jgi:hypothetical protein
MVRNNRPPALLRTVRPLLPVLLAGMLAPAAAARNPNSAGPHFRVIVLNRLSQRAFAELAARGAIGLLVPVWGAKIRCTSWKPRIRGGDESFGAHSTFPLGLTPARLPPITRAHIAESARVGPASDERLRLRGEQARFERSGVGGKAFVSREHQNGIGHVA